MIRSIAKLLRILNSETDPMQIGLAFALALVAGLTPTLSLHNLLVLLLALVLRVNLSAFFLGFVVFSAAGFVLDPLFHSMGLALLEAPALEGLWTTLYNSTLWRLERFNNTVVLGSLLASLLAFLPVVAVSNTLIRRFREHILEWARKTRIMRLFQASKLYRAYQAVSGLGEGA